MLYRLFLLFCFIVFFSNAFAEDNTISKTQENTVHRYIAMFNAHDTEGMLTMVTDDIQWLSIDGEKITKEANSKEELRSAMVAYFKSCSSCRSRLVHIFSTATRVSALEAASFETSNGRKEQQSLSLYEFSGTLIKRVYYFSAEK